MSKVVRCRILRKCLSLTQLLVRICSKFCSCPVIWKIADDEEAEGIPNGKGSIIKFIVPLPSHSSSLQRCTVVRRLCWTKSAIMSLRLVYSSYTTGINFRNGTGVVALVWTILNVFCSCCHIIFATNNGEKFCQTFNTFLTYRIRNGNLVKFRKLLLYLSIILVFIGIFGPILYPPISLIDPCASQYVGSLLFNCSKPESLHLFAKIFIYLIEVIMFCSQVQTGALVYLVGVLLLECLNRGAYSLLRISKLTFVFGANCNRLHYENQARNYREHQILLAIYNDCFKLHILPSIQFLTSASIISCLYAQIRYKNELPIVFIIFLNYLVFCASSCMIYLLDASSWIMLISQRILGKWKGSFYHSASVSPLLPRSSLNQPFSPLMKRPVWFRKFVRSCAAMKVYAGPFHPVGRDRLAVVLRFCMQRATFLLYASKDD